MRAIGVMAVAAAWLAGLPAAAQQDKALVMKLSTATLNDVQHEFMKNFAARVEKDSGGRIKAELYPASQLGSIPRQIEGTQFGAIQGWIGPPDFLVGIDERFEVMTAPGLVANLDQAIRLTQDPALTRLMLSMGTEKGLRGVAWFADAPSSIAAKKPVRHLAEFKGLRIRVLAGGFAEEQMRRLNATPVAMSLGDVLPGLQNGLIDAAVAQVAVFTTLQYIDAAKFITETNHNYIFTVVEMSRKWMDGLPADLQKIVNDDATAAAAEAGPWGKDFFEGQRKVWVEKGGELISLPPGEQDQMMRSLSGVGEDLSKGKPGLRDAYEALVAAVERTK